MSGTDRLICFVKWGGGWQEDGENRHFVGRNSKMLWLEADLNFIQLKEKVYSAIKLNPTTHDIRLSIQPTNCRYNLRADIAPVDDDEDVTAFLEYCRINHTRLVDLYVTVVTVNGGVNCIARDEHMGSSLPFPTVCLGDDNDDWLHATVDMDSNPLCDQIGNDSVKNASKGVCDDVIYRKGLNRHYSDNVNQHKTVSIGNSDDTNDVNVGVPRCLNEGIHAFGTPIQQHSRERMRIADYLWWLPDVPHGDSQKQTDVSKLRGRLHVDSVFVNKQALKDAFGLHAVENRYEWVVCRSSTSRYELKCKHWKDSVIGKTDCRWRANAYVSSGTTMFKVHRLDDMKLHTCGAGKDLIIPHHRHLGQRIAGMIVQRRLVKDKPRPAPFEIINQFKCIEKLDITYKQAWRARLWAEQYAAGSPEESYAWLPTYCENLKMVNPGTVTHIETEDDGRFKYFFMALGACIRGFREHIRPIIAVDGTHLKGKYRGILYTAVGHDGNGQLFPVAIAIGPNESNDSWLWFLTKLQAEISDVKDLVIISDRNSSIIYAISNVFPDAVHGSCAKHVEMNVIARHRGAKKHMGIYWKAVKSYRVSEFNDWFGLLRRKHPMAAQYLEDAGFDKWSRAFFVGRRYNIMTTNNAESMNAVAACARSLPITQLVEWCRSLSQRWAFERRGDASKRGDTFLCKWAEQVLTRRTMKSVQDGLYPIDAYTYQVTDGSYGGIVDIRAKTCTCRKLQLAQLPCRHIIKVAAHFKLNDAYQWVSHYYTNNYVKGAWADSVYPVPPQQDWTQCQTPMVVLPPRPGPGPTGRPRSQKRIPSQGEEVVGRSGKKRSRTKDPLVGEDVAIMKSRKCSTCRKVGHNRLNCEAAQTSVGTSAPAVAELPQSWSPLVRTPTVIRCSRCRQLGHLRPNCTFVIPNSLD